MQLGAVWAGEATAEPPAKLDAAIVFAPAGELVPPALKALKKGGVLVLGGIHMSPIPSFDYDLLYQERVIRSVANNTREDGEDFLRIGGRNPDPHAGDGFPFARRKPRAERSEERPDQRRRGSRLQAVVRRSSEDQPMKIVSVNVGLPRRFWWKDREVTTAIFK